MYLENVNPGDFVTVSDDKLNRVFVYVLPDNTDSTVVGIELDERNTFIIRVAYAIPNELIVPYKGELHKNSPLITIRDDLVNRSMCYATLKDYIRNKGA